jgi:HD-like signal output (HDOD) protein
VGSRLARRWRFPAPLLAPIEFHHETDSDKVRRELSPSLQATVDVVALANDLCRGFKIGDGGSPAPERHEEALLTRLGLSFIHIDDIYTQLMRRLETSKPFLDLIDDRGEPRPASSAR